MARGRFRYLPVGQPLPTDLGELEFENWVRYQAREQGWCGWHVTNSEGVVRGVHSLVAHNHDCSMGWPDWAFARADPPGFLIRELKTNTGAASRHQKHWLRTLRAAGVDTDIWRPRDYARILHELH